MSDLLARVRTLSTAALSWLILATVVIQSVIAEVGDDWPDVARYGSQVLVVLGFIIAAVRSVSPAENRGLLPD